MHWSKWPEIEVRFVVLVPVPVSNEGSNVQYDLCAASCTAYEDARPSSQGYCCMICVCGYAKERHGALAEEGERRGDW